MTSGVPLLAASFASKFDTIGPYVGFASLIAVVAMAILVFSQGRELQRLREWAGTSPERLEALEDEIRGRAFGGAPTQAQPKGTRPGTLARHPGVAAGAAVAGAGAGAPPGAPVTAAATATPPPPGSPVTGASTTADGAAVPPGGPRPVPPRPTPPGGPGATRILPASAPGGPRASTPAGMAASTARERAAADDAPRRSIGQIVGVGAVVLVVLVALLFAFGVIGGDPKNKGGANQDPNSPAAIDTTTPRKPARRYSKTETPVTVLNASGSSGKAKTVSDEIDQKLRFPMGRPSNYLVNGASPATPVPTTTVLYATGQGQSANRAAAQDIAKSLGLKTGNTVVRAMTPDAKANAPDAKVVVVVGQDLARKFAGEPSSASGTSGSTGDTSGGTTSGGGTDGTAPGTAGTTTPGTTGGTGSTSTPSDPVDPAAGTAGTPDGTADGTGAAGGGTTP